MTLNEKAVRFEIDSLLEKYVPGATLEDYFQVLMSHNKKVNLVSRETLPADLKRLAAESLLPLDIIENEAPDFKFDSYLDIGSGGGFPSVPIILARNIGCVRLVERTAKKASALEKIIRELKLEAEIIPRNFEEIKFDRSFELITLRYVKLTESLLKRIYRLLKENGRFIYYSSTVSELYKNSSEIYSFNSSEVAVNKSLTIYKK